MDAKDCSMGAWFEAQVVKVTVKKPSVAGEDGSSLSSDSHPMFCYHVLYDE